MIFDSLQLCLVIGNYCNHLMIVLISQLKSSSRLTIQFNSILFNCISRILISVLVFLLLGGGGIFDPEDVSYLYESPGGYSLVGVRMIGCVLLFLAGRLTLKHLPHNPFYVSFFIFYLVSITNPILILILIHAIGNWVRSTVSVGLDLSISFLGHAFFLIFAWPTLANKNFPLHTKVAKNQVSADDTSDSNTLSSSNNQSKHSFDAISDSKANKNINDVTISPDDYRPESSSSKLGSRRESFNISVPSIALALFLPTHRTNKSLVPNSGAEERLIIN
uniref:GPR180/TMEM145 transmembrane domain-containing protein n=1 Tax=Strigamia maritima TaxID=126957 RepID=T1JLF0_STRMM